uniref:Uncharacterized protein n=1 Tax=Heterosigma akashiwo TaxID=2829 RepID=A0A6V1TSL6_HETAK
MSAQSSIFSFSIYVSSILKDQLKAAFLVLNIQIQLYTQISAQSSIFSTQFSACSIKNPTKSLISWFSDFSIKYPTKSLISYSKFKKQQHIAAKTRKIIKITRLQISSVFKWPIFQ